MGGMLLSQCIVADGPTMAGRLGAQLIKDGGDDPDVTHGAENLRFRVPGSSGQSKNSHHGRKRRRNGDQAWNGNSGRGARYYPGGRNE